MRRWIYTGGVVLLALLLAVTVTHGQGTLSNQVLQLLTRDNSWTGTDTFYDLRVFPAAVPSVTTNRIYGDVAGNLYYNGGLIAGSGGGVTPHNILSSTHADSTAGTVVRGDVIVGDSTPKWVRLARCTTGFYIGSNGTDTGCATSAAAFTAIPAAQITGTASAFNGAAITALNATQLTSGTVPLARLVGITNTEVAGAAAIAYSKLALTGGIINADVSGSAAIAYSKLALTGSIVTGDLASATLLFNRWASNGCTNLQVPQYNGAAWVCKTLLTTDVTGAGTVSSVALTAPAIFSVTGSPVTTSGTLGLSLANETANFGFFGPTTGAAAAPTFRALVNADLPLSGVGAGSYAKVTVNTAGVVTAATTQASLTADVSGILPFANGGTGLAVAADDTVVVSTGAAWQAKTLPDCTTGALNYTQATNLFSCNTTPASHSLLSASHGDTTAAGVNRGDMIIGDATPKWVRKGTGTAGQLWGTDGTDLNWSYTVARGTITGSSPWTWTQTWNAAVTFVAAVVNITDTSSNADSKFIDYQVAGASQLYVRKDGGMVFAGVAFASLPAAPADGTVIYCTNCAIANPCAGAGTGAFAKRLNGVWVCN